MKRLTTIAAPVAHLIGPGKIKVVNSYLAFATKEQGPQRLDPETLHTLICYGPVGVTDDAFTVLFQHNVQVAWMTPGGNRCRGRLVRADPTTTLVRLLQYNAFLDLDWCRSWANDVVRAKVQSQAAAARHYQRHSSTAAGESPARHSTGWMDPGLIRG